MRQDCCEQDELMQDHEPAVFDLEHPVTVLGFPEPVIAEDLKHQDFVQVPRHGITWVDQWLVIEQMHRASDGEHMHLLFRPADSVEVADERRGIAELDAAEARDRLRY